MPIGRPGPLKMYYIEITEYLYDNSFYPSDDEKKRRRFFLQPVKSLPVAGKIFLRLRAFLCTGKTVDGRVVFNAILKLAAWIDPLVLPIS